MKIKIPETIKVGGHVYHILKDYKFQERYDITGQCDYQQGIIRINYQDGGSIMRTNGAIAVTFIHVIIHAIDYRYNSGKELNDRAT